MIVGRSYNFSAWKSILLEILFNQAKHKAHLERLEASLPNRLGRGAEAWLPGVTRLTEKS